MSHIQNLFCFVTGKDAENNDGAQEQQQSQQQPMSVAVGESSSQPSQSEDSNANPSQLAESSELVDNFR